MTHTSELSDILGVDIGGANLKYATEDGRCFDRPFPMWTRSCELAEQLASDIGRFEGVKQLAVTMTGELADCFPSRAAGVTHIVDQVIRCIPHVALESASFYGTDGRFHDEVDAKRNWELIAASNWHALASCVGKQIASNALLIDVGSTTTDVIAIHQGKVVTTSRTDFERLRDQSLVYVGCRRTPVCALVSELMIDGKSVAIMKEVFATIDDARLLLGLQAGDLEDFATADNQPRSRVHARARLARMIGRDRNQINESCFVEIANQVVQAASLPMNAAVQTWWHRLMDLTDGLPTVVCSGHGQDLVTIPKCDTHIDLREKLPLGISRAAPAWATAVLRQLAALDDNEHRVQSAAMPTVGSPRIHG